MAPEGNFPYSQFATLTISNMAEEGNFPYSQLATLTISNMAPEGRESRDRGSGGGNFILEKMFTSPHLKLPGYPGLSAPYSKDLSPCDFWLFPKLKSPLKRRRFVNATGTQYTSSVNGVSLPTD